MAYGKSHTRSVKGAIAAFGLGADAPQALPCSYYSAGDGTYYVRRANGTTQKVSLEEARSIATCAGMAWAPSKGDTPVIGISTSPTALPTRPRSTLFGRGGQLVTMPQQPARRPPLVIVGGGSGGGMTLPDPSTPTPPIVVPQPPPTSTTQTPTRPPKVTVTTSGGARPRPSSPATPATTSSPGTYAPPATSSPTIVFAPTVSTSATTPSSGPIMAPSPPYVPTLPAIPEILESTSRSKTPWLAIGALALAAVLLLKK